MLLPVVVVGLAATIGMNFQVTIPPFARDVLGGDAAAFGFLMTASGVGSVAAALYLATRRRPSPWAIAAGATMLGAGLLLAAAVPVYAVALPALAFAGFGAIWMAANGNTLIQATVPDELRGRVISVYTTVFAGSTPIGALFAGFLASRWGAVAALAVGGVLTDRRGRRPRWPGSVAIERSALAPSSPSRRPCRSLRVACRSLSTRTRPRFDELGPARALGPRGRTQGLFALSRRDRSLLREECLRLRAIGERDLRANPGDGEGGDGDGSTRRLAEVQAVGDEDGQAPDEGVARPGRVDGRDLDRGDMMGTLGVDEQGAAIADREHDRPWPLIEKLGCDALHLGHRHRPAAGQLLDLHLVRGADVGEPQRARRAGASQAPG